MCEIKRQLRKEIAGLNKAKKVVHAAERRVGALAARVMNAHHYSVTDEELEGKGW
jgi:hypothetical protein